MVTLYGPFTVYNKFLPDIVVIWFKNELSTANEDNNKKLSIQGLSEGEKKPCFTGERIPKSGRSVGHIFFNFFFYIFCQNYPKKYGFFLLASLEIFHSNICPKTG